MGFIKKLEKSSKEKDSRLILALDLSVELYADEAQKWPSLQNKLLKRAIEVIEKTHEHLAAVKLNKQLVLPLGLYNGVQKIIGLLRDTFNLPVIMDEKLNDVGHTNLWICRHYLNAGFDAIIVNPFVGWEGALDKVFEEAKEKDFGVILLVYMTHGGAKEGFNRKITPKKNNSIYFYQQFAMNAREWQSDGVVVGATYPDKIREVRRIIGDHLPIFSPGIGPQGGEVSKAFKAGTDYAIVGRSIFNANNPKLAAMELKEMINSVIDK